MSNPMKGFKVFNPDWTCRGFQYRVGETYLHDGEIDVGKAGFHFCQVASACFSYRPFQPDSRIAEVEAIGHTKTRGSQSVTDCIRIVREISWQELLAIANTGMGCTGFGNSGHRNSGKHNSGCRNSGSFNSGSLNSGKFNSGDFNSGHCNSGNFNSGCLNSGKFNSGNFNSGFFNTDEPFARSFNKPTEIRMSEFYRIKGIEILERRYKNNYWIDSANMSEEEKTAYPEHVTTGGYLKTVPVHEAYRVMWEHLSDEEKDEVRKIPNFDAAIFEEITGIKA